MEVGAFYLPSVGRKEDIEAGMAGKRTDLYQQMLGELTEQIQYLSLIHISEPTRHICLSRMPSSA